MKTFPLETQIQKADNKYISQVELTALLILSAIMPLKVENSHTFLIKGMEEVNTSFFFLTKSPLLV